MIKKLYFLIMCGFSMLSIQSSGQNTAEENNVKEVISRVFKAMELGDSAMLHLTFAKSANMVSMYRDKNNEPVMKREDSIDDFLKAIGTPHQEKYYEEIWNVKILIDGDFAQAWCDYAFYVGNTFSHCGVDAFHFHKGKNGWKIFHLADTRRKTGCEIPKAIQDKHREK